MFLPVLLLVLSVLLPGCSALHLTASPVFEATVQHLPNPGDTVLLFPSKRRNGAQDLARTEQEAITTGHVEWTALGTYADPCFDCDQYVFKCSRGKDSFGWNLVKRSLDAAWTPTDQK